MEIKLKFQRYKYNIINLKMEQKLNLKFIDGII